MAPLSIGEQTDAARACIAGCHRPLVHRRLWITLVTAGLFAALALHQSSGPALAPELVLVAALVPLAWCDLEHLLLPRTLVWAGVAAVGTTLLASATVSGDWHGVALGTLCAVATGLFFGTISIISPKLLGFGDARLSVLIGLGLGSSGVDRLVLGLVLANLAAAVVSMGLVITRRAKATLCLPFGVFLTGGTLAALMLGR